MRCCSALTTDKGTAHTLHFFMKLQATASLTYIKVPRKASIRYLCVNCQNSPLPIQKILSTTPAGGDLWKKLKVCQTSHKSCQCGPALSYGWRSCSLSSQLSPLQEGAWSYYVGANSLAYCLQAKPSPNTHPVCWPPRCVSSSCLPSPCQAHTSTVKLLLKRTFHPARYKSASLHACHQY